MNFYSNSCFAVLGNITSVHIQTIRVENQRKAVGSPVLLGQCVTLLPNKTKLENLIKPMAFQLKKQVRNGRWVHSKYLWNICLRNG